MAAAVARSARAGLRGGARPAGADQVGAVRAGSRARGGSSASRRRNCASRRRRGPIARPWPVHPTDTSCRRTSPCCRRWGWPRAEWPVFPWRPETSAVAAAVAALPAVAAAGRFAVLNPGAAWPNKRWPAARFGAAGGPLGAKTACPASSPGEARSDRSPRRSCRARGRARRGLAGHGAERPARAGPAAPAWSCRRHRSAASGRVGRGADRRGCSGRPAPNGTGPWGAADESVSRGGDVRVLPQAPLRAGPGLRRRHRGGRSDRRCPPPAGPGGRR